MKFKDVTNINDVREPKGSNKSNAWGSFYWRDLYDSLIFKEGGFDLWYKFNFFGRVNTKGEPVFVSENFLKQVSNNDKTILLLAPVADAWKDLISYMQKAVSRGDVDPEGSLYGDIKPKHGWTSPHKLYGNYNSTLYESFSGKFMNSKLDHKIVDFEGFLDVWLVFVEMNAKRIPWTREGYFLSKKCTPHVSGLMIELAEAPHDLDSLKATFLQDRNFNFFKTAAARHGFILDKNAPWRVVADMESRGMKRYMKKYGKDKETIYEYYYKGYEHELENFKHFLWGWYNDYVKANPVVQVVEAGSNSLNPTKLDLIQREVYTEEELFEKYSDHFFIKLYTYVRAIETKKDWGQARYDMVVYKARDLMRLKGKNTAMKYLHKNINPCSEKRAKELFGKKHLTKDQTDVILLSRNKIRPKFRYR